MNLVKEIISNYIPFCLVLLLLVLPEITNAQSRLMFHWGWNRANYSKSDIHLKGNNYDFTLHDVVAKDRQTPFSFDVYFHPTKFSPIII